MFVQIYIHFAVLSRLSRFNNFSDYVGVLGKVCAVLRSRAPRCEASGWLLHHGPREGSGALRWKHNLCVRHPWVDIQRWVRRCEDIERSARKEERRERVRCDPKFFAAFDFTFNQIFLSIVQLFQLAATNQWSTSSIPSRWNIPIHVDAASGGFIAPFLYPDIEWDFRLPLVKSINVSGHKYGLVYAGIGWVVWRNKEDLPEELVFHVNYLGADQPTFTLNFSKGTFTKSAKLTFTFSYCSNLHHHVLDILMQYFENTSWCLNSFVCDVLQVQVKWSPNTINSFALDLR